MPARTRGKIRLRGDVWHYDFRVGGQRHRGSTGETDRKRAEAAAIQIEARLRGADRHGPQSVLTFADATLRYLDAGRDRRFLLPLLDHFGPQLVRDIRPGDIRAAALHLMPGASPATRNRQIITPAQAVINTAADLGLCEPIRVKRFPVKTKVRPVPDDAWIAAFRASAPPRLAALQRFMAETGRRISDATSLRWGDVDLARGEALIRDPKNGDDQTVYLQPGLVAALANLDTQGRGGSFATVFGYASRSSVYKSWNRVIARAGIAHITTHEAGRHWFATHLIVERGVDAKTTQVMGGWRSRASMDGYVHARMAREVSRAVFGIDGAVGSAPRGTRGTSKKRAP